MFIIHVYKEKIYKKEKLTMEAESVILQIGDLVIIKQSIYAPFYNRPIISEIGVVLEVDYHDVLGSLYYVQTSDGIWKFSDYELELLDESR